MRCPDCGATNPDSATFCGQCYRRFASAELLTATPPPVRTAPAEGPTWAAADDADRPLPTMEPGPPPPSIAGDVRAGRFHASGGLLGWSCALCGEGNELDVFACTVCGARMDAEAPDHANLADWSTARRHERLAPGVGHIQVGAVGPGAARVVTAVLWLIGVLMLAPNGRSGLLTSVPLIAGVLVIWVTGPGDLDALREGRPPRLDARRFLYLVIGVVVGVITVGGFGVLL